MRKRVILLGASGNIGLQTIDIIKQQSDRFEIIGVSVGRDVENLLVTENEFLKKQVKYICTGRRRDDLAELYPDCQFFYGFTTKIIESDNLAGFYTIRSQSPCTAYRAEINCFIFNNGISHFF